MAIPQGHLTSLLASMPEGIGDHTFGTEPWLKAGGEVLSRLVLASQTQLENAPKFTCCMVGHNPPAYLHLGTPIAWNFTVDRTKIYVRTGELPIDECDVKVVADHSILSNYARILRRGNNPAVANHARERLLRIGRWDVQGQWPEHSALQTLLTEFHDAMASKTMPRFTFMTPEWVSVARYVLTSRSISEKYRDTLKPHSFTFSEEFTHTPKYAFPDGSHGGFWVKCDNGLITVGAGPLPQEHEPADMLTKGMYTPVVPVGRTVNVALTEEDKQAQVEYSKTAFARDAEGNAPVNQSSPSNGGPMPPDLGRVFLPLHDELSKRTSSELPSDFDTGLDKRWTQPQVFDRDPSFDKSWLRYDEFDIYGNPR